MLVWQLLPFSLILDLILLRIVDGLINLQARSFILLPAQLRCGDKNLLPMNKCLIVHYNILQGHE